MAQANTVAERAQTATDVANDTGDSRDHEKAAMAHKAASDAATAQAERELHAGKSRMHRDISIRLRFRTSGGAA